MRINIIPVKLLSNQHLIAEYREIKMLPKALVITITSKQGLVGSKIPSEYTLNKGHGYFFYDKLDFIENRFIELCNEMRFRKFTVNCNSLYDENFDYSYIPSRLCNDYTPTYEANCINVERILQRIYEMIYIKGKVNFYKYNKEDKTFDEWVEFYLEELQIYRRDMYKILSNIKVTKNEN